ncbi:hypothetical protein CFC21_037173 [Triticum aestivum]|uniref:Uncharacterized protein n=3 Tax=Triticum TaxID=4564 RepID=A0A9R0RUI9_TRITD|nr:hypothetical protein CFC21_037173 [Triticum aestivum]VAH66660.1 unnamed protein product [Triticum turgidum subsp. durum]
MATPAADARTGRIGPREPTRAPRSASAPNPTPAPSYMLWTEIDKSFLVSHLLCTGGGDSMAVVHLYFGVDVHVAIPCDGGMKELDAGWGYGRPGHSHGYRLIAGSGHILPPPATTEHAPSAAGRPNPEQPRGLSRVRRIVCSEPAQAVGIPMGAETNLSSPQLDPTKSRESVTLLNDDQNWMLALRESVSFGRFLAEPLEWDTTGHVSRWQRWRMSDHRRQLSLICQYMPWRSDFNLCPPAAVLRTLEVLDQPRVVIHACLRLVRH